MVISKSLLTGIMSTITYKNVRRIKQRTLYKSKCSHYHLIFFDFYTFFMDTHASFSLYTFAYYPSKYTSYSCCNCCEEHVFSLLLQLNYYNKKLLNILSYPSTGNFVKHENIFTKIDPEIKSVYVMYSKIEKGNFFN